MKLDIRDIKSRSSQNIKIDFETCPVGEYNMHGKVERKIQEVKKSIEKTMLNERLFSHSVRDLCRRDSKQNQ